MKQKLKKDIKQIISEYVVLDTENNCKWLVDFENLNKKIIERIDKIR